MVVQSYRSEKLFHVKRRHIPLAKAAAENESVGSWTGGVTHDGLPVFVLVTHPAAASAHDLSAI